MKAKKTNEIEEDKKWFKKNRVVYEQLSKEVESIVHKVLEANKIEIHSIQSRCKSIESFGRKLEVVEYSGKDFQDLAGVRIICYFNSDLDTVSKIIEKIFDIDTNRSKDKGKILEQDKVGYRSRHYVAKLDKKRLALPEFVIYKDFFFEIQIRTILQHAWAEIEHDRSYKFSGILPPEIKRRFNLLAGLLEVADNEFNQISSQIESYKEKVSKQTETGEFNIELNSTSLRQFLIDLVKDIPNIVYTFGPKDEFASYIIDELKRFNIHSLAELKAIIKKDFITKFKEFSLPEHSYNLLGITRDIMIIHDSKKYFEKAWNRDWQKFNPCTETILNKYGVNTQAIAEKYNLLHIKQAT